MAGIAAIFKKKKITPKDIAVLHLMMEKMHHRGHAQVKIIISKCFLMSIGMSKNEARQYHVWNSKDNSKAIICDGNISLDAEEISKIFECENINSINLFNEGFAIAGFNKENFYISRDYIGMKPLYQGYTKEALYLASELKCMPDFLDRIDIFPPGHFYSKKTGLKKYFSFKKINKETKNVENIKKCLLTNLERTVHTELNSTGNRQKVGALLSGGIDSSIITAILSKNISNLNTFSVGTAESEDLEYARKVASVLGTKHHEFVYNLDKIVEIIADVIYSLESYDVPTVRSSVANYFAAKEASKRVSRVFIGEGGDENYGGYHHLKNEKCLHKKLVKLFQSLHNIGCQRVDRMNARFSLEVHAPFLNKNLIVLPSLKIPSDLKIYGNSKIEKWILRKTFEAYLPDEIIWRPKKQFAKGSGSEDILIKFTDEQISDEQFEKEIKKYSDTVIRSKEELFYFKIFKSYFRHPDAAKTVGLWYE